jgi:uncharacterized protein YbaP (TraB family)
VNCALETRQAGAYALEPDGAGAERDRIAPAAGGYARYHALLADARRRAWVSDPSALEASDRALIEGALHG